MQKGYDARVYPLRQVGRGGVNCRFTVNRVTTTFVGIDVGGERKGFHAVALQGGAFVATLADSDPAVIAGWCRQLKAVVVAVDVPCGWSDGGASRLAERSLAIGGNKISCFATPTRARANRSNFYKWVFNGERLYRQLAKHYLLFDGSRRAGLTGFETFPHAVVCALAGRVVLARPKAETRRNALRQLGYDVSSLSNVDLVDALETQLAASRAAANLLSALGAELTGTPHNGKISVPSVSTTGSRGRPRKSA